MDVRKHGKALQNAVTGHSYAPKRLNTDDFRIKKYPFEIVQTREGYYEIHIWQRPDVPTKICEQEIKMTMVRVFGKKKRTFELIYRDEAAIKHKLEMESQVLPVNSFMITIKPPTCWIYSREDLGRRLANILAEFS